MTLNGLIKSPGISSANTVFCIWKYYHFYYPSYQYNYPLEDQKKIKDYLSCATMSSDTQALASWRPFQLSDRVMLIYSMNYMNTSLSALLDLNERPSWNPWGITICNSYFILRIIPFSAIWT